MGQGNQIDSSEPKYALPIGIACMACGYDLRGLDPGGRCPECGHDVGASLVQHLSQVNDRRGTLYDAHPSWTKKLFEGSVFLLIVIALWMYLVFAPEEMYARKSTERKILLVIASTAWVCTWFGLWKLTSRPPATHDSRLEKGWRLILRTSSTSYAALPFIYVGANCLERDPGPVWEAVFLISFFCGGISTVASHQFLHHLAVRLPSLVLAVQFHLLSIVVGVAALFILSKYGTGNVGDPSTLAFLAEMPSPVIGSALLVRKAFDRGFLDVWQQMDVFSALFLVIPFWTFITLSCFAAKIALQRRIAKKEFS